MIEDRSLFFADLGVSATFGAETANVLFDAPEPIIADGVISADYRITYPTGTFAGMQYGSTIVVDGTTYRVDTVQAVDDGKLTQATLSST